MTSMAPRPGGDPRQQLLERAIGYLSEQGIGDVSLREPAAALGTSHRMLIYHFGSEEGLFLAVVQETENRQRRLLASMFGSDASDFGEAARQFWRQLRSPSSRRWNGSSSSSTRRRCTAAATRGRCWPWPRGRTIPRARTIPAGA